MNRLTVTVEIPIRQGGEAGPPRFYPSVIRSRARLTYDEVHDVLAGACSVNTAVPGAYLLTYTATDSAGSSASAIRTVQVRDTLAPVVTLNGLAELTVECHGTFTDSGASATDACAGSVAVTASGSVDANTPGTYILTYSATDPAGNGASAIRTVTVLDATAPAITLTGPATLTVECHDAFTDPGATALDACAGMLTPTLAGTVDANTPGTYTLTYSATDPAGNTG